MSFLKKILIIFFLFLSCKEGEEKFKKIEKEMEILKNRLNKIESKLDSIKKDFEEYKKSIESRILIIKGTSEKKIKDFRHPWDKSCNKCH